MSLDSICGSGPMNPITSAAVPVGITPGSSGLSAAAGQVHHTETAAKNPICGLTLPTHRLVYNLIAESQHGM